MTDKEFNDWPSIDKQLTTSQGLTEVDLCEQFQFDSNTDESDDDDETTVSIPTIRYLLGNDLSNQNISF